MGKMLMELLKEEEGQALTEYGLIIALIAVACVVALGLMGTNISGMFNSIATKITAAP